MSAKLRVWLGWGIAAAVLVGVPLAVAFAPGQPAGGGPRRAIRYVVFVNPLDEAVTIRVGAAKVAVKANARTSAAIPEGPTDVEVHLDRDGRLIDRHRLQVTAGGGTALYSVLGAAPLFTLRIAYTPTASNMKVPDSVFTPLVGERYLVVQADFVFSDPPQRLQTSSSGPYVWKTQLGVLPGGWAAGMNALVDRAGMAPAYPVARRVHRAFPEDWLPLAWLLATSNVVDGPEVTADLAAQAVARAPNAFEAHRSLAGLSRELGHGAELVEVYRALAAREPDSALPPAMLLRLLPRAEAEALAPAAVAAHPTDREVLTGAAYVALQTGRAADAAALYQRVPLGKNNGFVEYLVRALIQSGRARDAAAAALAAARAPDADATDVALFVRTARLPGAQPGVKVEDFLGTWAAKEPENRTWVHAVLGDAPSTYDHEHVPTWKSFGVADAATRDPVRALALCRSIGPAHLMNLPAEIAALLAAEAYRLGQLDTFARLRRHLSLGTEQIAAYVDAGVEPADGWRLDPGERAALALARVRRLQSLGAPVPEVIRAALRADALRGPATLAADRWPPPERAEAPVLLVREP